MTVYELIQELSQYNADTEVKFHCEAEYDTGVEAEFDRENENDTQEVTVTASFDDDVDFDDIDDYEPMHKRTWQKGSFIVINLSY
jgi:hypothetical protein